MLSRLLLRSAKFSGPRFSRNGPSLVRFSTRETTSALDADAWNNAWQQEVADIKYLDNHFDSAAQLRGIVSRGLLKFSDLRDAPARFFEAHRQIAARSTELGPGFFIRFTVQYNLFAGTILGCGGETHLELLDEMQAKGQLGCFALTEKFAGVNSGLVVNTEIEWDHAARKFILNTPTEGAKKNWISQGFTADKAVVIANLTVGGQAVGPHAFVMDFRDEAGDLNHAAANRSVVVNQCNHVRWLSTFRLHDCVFKHVLSLLCLGCYCFRVVNNRKLGPGCGSR